MIPIGIPLADHLIEEITKPLFCDVADRQYPVLEPEFPHDAPRFMFVLDRDAGHATRQREDHRMEPGPDQEIQLVVGGLDMPVVTSLLHEHRLFAAAVLGDSPSDGPVVIISVRGCHLGDEDDTKSGSCLDAVDDGRDGPFVSVLAIRIEPAADSHADKCLVPEFSEVVGPMIWQIRMEGKTRVDCPPKDIRPDTDRAQEFEA